MRVCEANSAYYTSIRSSALAGARARAANATEDLGKGGPPTKLSKSVTIIFTLHKVNIY